MEAIVQFHFKKEDIQLNHSPNISKIKPNGQLEVKLDGSTLMVPTNCIFDFNINL